MKTFLALLILLIIWTNRSTQQDDFLSSLEIKDKDPKSHMESLLKQFGVSDHEKIHRKIFQKILAEMSMGKPFKELQQIQIRFNSQGKYHNLDSEQNNIGELMNDLQKFMGLIEGRYISMQKVEEIILQRKFHIFVHNLLRKGMNKKKQRIERSEPVKHKQIEMTEFQDLDLQFIQIIMGVQYLYSWLKKRYPQAFISQDIFNQPLIDHLYMDLNGILYKAIQYNDGVFKEYLKIWTLKDILDFIKKNIAQLIWMLKPKKSVTLVLDGVAPNAKLKDQRNRRYKRYWEKINQDQFLSDFIKIDLNQLSEEKFQISLGSNFMEQVNQAMDQLIEEMALNEECFNNVLFFYSGVDEPGEGEHKLLDLIRDWKINNQFCQETHCFYGNDSDLILLSLASGLNKFWVFREQFPPFQKEFTSECNQRHSKDEPMEMINIQILRELITIEFIQPLGNQFDQQKLIKDFLIVIQLVGNDFLPQLFCMNIRNGDFDLVLDQLRNFYFNFNQYLVKQDQIDYEMLAHFFNMLIPLQQTLIQSTIKGFQDEVKQLTRLPFISQKSKKNKDQEEDKFFSHQVQQLNKRIETLQHLDLLIINQQEYKSYFYQEFLDHKNFLSKACHYYFKTLQFVFDYYVLGCQCWGFQYPFETAPLIEDLSLHLKILYEQKLQFQFRFNNKLPLVHHLQQLAIIPLSGLIANYPKESKLILKDPKTRQMYPMSFDINPIDWFKQHTWHAHLPKISINSLRKATNNQQESDQDVIQKRFQVKYQQNGKFITERVINNNSKPFQIYIQNSHPQEQLDISIESQTDQFKCPSIHYFNNVTFTRSQKKNLETLHLVLTKQSLIDYLERINLQVKRIQQNQEINKKHKIYANIFNPQMLICHKIIQVNKEQYYETDIVKLIKGCLMRLQSQGILLENPAHLLDLPYMIYFQVEHPTQTISKNDAFSEIELQTDHWQQFESVLFLEASLERKFTPILEHADSIDQFNNQFCVAFDLNNGQKIKNQSKNQKQQKIQNKENKPQKLIGLILKLKKSPQDVFYPLTEKIAQEMGFTTKTSLILFIVLDRFLISTDNNCTSYGYLKEQFQVGLEFIKFVNQNKKQFKVVPHLIQIIEDPSSKDVIVFPSINQQKGRFGVSLTKEGYGYLSQYLINHRHLIQALIKICKKDGFIAKNAQGNQIIRTKFYAQELQKYLPKDIANPINAFIFKEFTLQCIQPYSQFCLFKNNGFKASQSQIQVLEEFLINQNFEQKKKQTEQKCLIIKSVPWLKDVKLQNDQKSLRLFDRVVLVTDKDNKGYLGLKGTIIGLYQNKVQIISDKEFIGGDTFGGILKTNRGLVTQRSNIYAFDYIFSIFTKSKQNSVEERGVLEQPKVAPLPQ